MRGTLARRIPQHSAYHTILDREAVETHIVHRFCQQTSRIGVVYTVDNARMKHEQKETNQS